MSCTAPRPAPAGRPRSTGRPRPTPRRGARAARHSRTAPGALSRAAAMRPARSVLPGSPNGTNGSRGMKSAGLRQRGRVRDLTGERQRHRRRKVGVRERPDIRARRVDRQVDRQVRGRCEPGSRPGGRRIPGDGHDHDVIGIQLVLATARWRERDVLLVETDREVALASRDQAARPEASAGRDDGHCSIRQVHGRHRRAGVGVPVTRTIPWCLRPPSTRCRRPHYRSRGTGISRSS